MIYEKLKKSGRFTLGETCFEERDEDIGGGIYLYHQIEPQPVKASTLDLELENCYSLNSVQVKHARSGEIVTLKALLSRREIYVEIDRGMVNKKARSITYTPTPDGSITKTAGMVNVGTYHQTLGAILDLENDTLQILGNTIEFDVPIERLNNSADWLIQGLLSPNAKGDELEKGINARLKQAGSSAELNKYKITRNYVGGWNLEHKLDDGRAAKLPIGSLIRSLCAYVGRDLDETPT